MRTFACFVTFICLHSVMAAFVMTASAQNTALLEVEPTKDSNATQPLSSASQIRLSGEVIYGRKSGMALTYDIIQPAEIANANGAAVIFVVSGGWNSNWFPPENFRQMGLLGKIHDQGYVLILLRHGSAPRFKVPEAVADVKLAVRHVRSQADQIGFDPHRLGICGASAGGHLSLMVGTTGDDGNAEDPSGSVDAAACRVACLAAYFPPTDLRNMVGPSDRFPALDFNPNLAESVSPIAHVTDDDAPILLVHGTADRLVPLRHSQRLLEEYESVGLPSKLVVLDGAGHGFRGRHAVAAESAVIEWFNKYLLADDDGTSGDGTSDDKTSDDGTSDDKTSDHE